MSGKTASAYMPSVLKPAGLTHMEECIYNMQLVTNNLGMGLAGGGYVPYWIPYGMTASTAMYYAFCKKSPTPFGDIDIPVIGEAARTMYWTAALGIAFNVPGALPGMLLSSL